MHGPVEVNGEGHLEGKSGRTIIVNPSWNNPTGKFHVGFKVSCAGAEQSSAWFGLLANSYLLMIIIITFVEEIE
jgi:hypothetical protein